MLEDNEKIIWEGYQTTQGSSNFIYSVKLSLEKFNKLWKDFKNYDGSQREFYFKNVNPMKIRRKLLLISNRI